jgi:uncharacterized cupin superfamily protein
MNPIEPVNEANLPWTENPNGTPPGFEMRRKQLGKAAGGVEIGCSLTEVAPGNRSTPFHAHLGNEEALYVLAGEGFVRLVDREVPLRPGDYVAFPAGPGSAHQVINRSSAPLRFLAFSTMKHPDLVLYGDSNKVFAIAGAPPGGAREQRTLSALFPLAAKVDYWSGEGGQR